MLIKNFFRFGLIAILLAGCGGVVKTSPWDIEYDPGLVSTPTQLEYGTNSGYGIDMSGTHNIAVLLPLTGDNAQIGRGIQNSIALALFQTQPNGLNVHFYDTSRDASGAITSALSASPEIIIGPIFSSNAALLRSQKPDNIPALTFTSDAGAVGSGVISMALMPMNSVEAIIDEMSSDKVKKFIIVAPDDISGHILTANAQNIAQTQNMDITGVFYYEAGNSELIKSLMETASMAKDRTAANNKAREILSDIITNETLSGAERTSIARQINELSKVETIGSLPYDAVLFLGGGEDTKELASFLRYYGADSHSVHFYGTAQWDDTDIISDFTMSGAKYAALPEYNPDFIELYKNTYGTTPTRLNTFGYDAIKIAMGMLYSTQSNGTYLLNQSGFYGIAGLIRLNVNGTNERGLRIIQLNGTDTPRIIKQSPTNFITPIYNTTEYKTSGADAMELQTPGINPMDYITIPERLRYKYKPKTYGTTQSSPVQTMSVITTVQSDTGDAIKESGFKPIKHESIKQTYIDSVEIEG
ncbi:MAG: penicillin-binding protein activator [Proteobacteria bacterium]|nr:penicillin-binding protein activator [Candidatus Enterousia scatequi]